MPDTRVTSELRGQTVLNNPALNKGTAFTPEERCKYGLEGFLPSAVDTLDRQVSRVPEQRARSRSIASTACERFRRFSMGVASPVADP